MHSHLLPFFSLTHLLSTCYQVSQNRVPISNDHPALNSVLVRPSSGPGPGDAVRGPIGHDEAIAIMVMNYLLLPSCSKPQLFFLVFFQYEAIAIIVMECCRVQHPSYLSLCFIFMLLVTLSHCIMRTSYTLFIPHLFLLPL